MKNLIQILPHKDQMTGCSSVSIDRPKCHDLFFHHFQNLFFPFFFIAAGKGKRLQQPQGTDRHLLRKYHMSGIKYRDLNTSTAYIDQDTSFLNQQWKIFHSGHYFVPKRTLFRIAQYLYADPGADTDLFQYEDHIGCVFKCAAGKHQTFLTSIALADLIKFIQYFTQLIYFFIANPAVFIHFTAEIQPAANLIHIVDLLFPR